MAKITKKNSVEDWTKTRDYKNTETLKHLTLAYIYNNDIDWNTKTGKNRVTPYIEN
jgi:hypothetical protein